MRAVDKVAQVDALYAFFVSSVQNKQHEILRTNLMLWINTIWRKENALVAGIRFFVLCLESIYIWRREHLPKNIVVIIIVVIFPFTFCYFPFSIHVERCSILKIDGNQKFTSLSNYYYKTYLLKALSLFYHFQTTKKNNTLKTFLFCYRKPTPKKKLEVEWMKNLL